MNSHTAVETYTRRASRYGEYIRTYREPALALLMLESLRIETGLKAIDLGYGQGDSSKHSRAVGADVVYVDGNRDIFRNGREAQVIVEAFRQEYNNYRPHSALGYLTPTEFARRYCEKNQVETVNQALEKAGSLSLELVLEMGARHP